MRPVLISLIIVMMFVVGSCGDDKNENSIPVGSLGFPCIDIGDGVCVDDLVCEDGICVVDESGDTGNTGNTGNTGDTSNIEDTCPENNKFCHYHDDLKWSDISAYSMTWDASLNYCKDLGGRFPTISELRTLIQNCPVTETGGSCGVNDSCLFSSCHNSNCDGCGANNSGIYSVFGDNSVVWSSSLSSDVPNYAWSVDFGRGSIAINTDKIYVRCVHDLVACKNTSDCNISEYCDLENPKEDAETNTLLYYCKARPRCLKNSDCPENWRCFIDEGFCITEKESEGILCKSDEECIFSPNTKCNLETGQCYNPDAVNTGNTNDTEDIGDAGHSGIFGDKNE
jgi:hypothetical protein